MKKTLKLIKRILLLLVTTLVGLFILLYVVIGIMCHGPSKSASNLFATTILESGQMKFIADMFYSKEELDAIIKQNSMTTLKEDTDDSLIEVSANVENDITIEKVAGDNFEGTMMIINDPSRVFVGTTYPWGEYGVELENLVKKYDATAGVNGGLYVSTMNKGGRPIGPVVSQGVIQNMNGIGYAGLHLIGMSESHVLKIIDLSGKNEAQIRKIIDEEKIRDAVCFQDEASDSNNHFVKLIVNGEKRELNGRGSGANPRTAIGQTKDGKILILVTDGRGGGGHLGATAADLIEIFDKYEAINAANIDGGSSSAMYYNGEYLRTSVTLYYSNSSWKIPDGFLVR